jgi:hypothetical protein
MPISGIEITDVAIGRLNLAIRERGDSANARHSPFTPDQFTRKIYSEYKDQNTDQRVSTPLKSAKLDTIINILGMRIA